MESLNKPKKASKKTCTNRVKCEGLKKDGTLRKGYMFQKGTNNVIKKTVATKKTTKTTSATKRKTSVKKKSGIFGLGFFGL